MSSVRVEEKYLGRNLYKPKSGNGGSAQIEYIIQGTDDDIAATEALEGIVPEKWNDLPLIGCEVKQIASAIWEGVARYGYNNSSRDKSESNYSFETGGGTQHITQSLATIQKYAPAGKTAPDFKGAICVDNNSVNGCDIVVPVYTWTDVYYFDHSEVTDNYKAALKNLTGKINNSAWKGNAAGEVLFMGASGSKRGNYGDWEIAFKFAASSNVTDKTIGDISGIAKKGWEFLWVRYEDADDDNAKVLIKKPSAVFIEQVYEYGDFGGLGI
ncbi:MAG: hypothetical protein WC496_02860 [Phycisphaerae bacterium]|jgi:hypothetical protein